MLSHETLVAVFIASLAFAYVPGPALVYAAAQTIANGRRAGLMAALGIHLGGYTHVVAVALGVAVIFDHSPHLFTAVKVVGLGYLFWLGVGLLRARQEPSGIAPGTQRRVFRQSVCVETFNPATAIFFLAFLPQFVDFGSDLPAWLQLLFLGAIVNAVFSSVELLCVLFSSQVMQFFRIGAGRDKRLQRLGGVLLIAISLNLALTGE